MADKNEQSENTSWIDRNIKSPIRRFIGLIEDNPITRERRTQLQTEHPKIVDAVQQAGNTTAEIFSAPFIAYAGLQALPIILPAMRVAGQAMTPSTWIGGVSKAFGYTAPNWILNGADLALGSKFAYEAGKDIDKNGLTWKTGLNALLSLAPLTRETEAIDATANALKKPLQSVASVVDDFRSARAAVSSPTTNFAREFSRSIDNARFVNMPVEHVSTNGLTEGANLNSFSNYDVGFHFSPAGSTTTRNIQTATKAPFIRTGTFTYTNNTMPVFVVDKGNWTYNFNPEIYKGVNPGTTPAENAMALNSKAPNYTYINNYEGNGAQSYMTVEPGQVVLSKNIEYPQKPLEIAHTDPKNASIKVLGDGTRVRNDDYQTSLNSPFWRANNYFQKHVIQDSYGYIPNFKVHTFIQNGKEYRIGNFSGEDKYIVLDNITGEWDSRRVSLDKAIDKILDQRERDLSKLDKFQRELINQSKVAYDEDKALFQDFATKNEILKSGIMQSINNDIDDIYLSDEYIDRYLETLGFDKNNQKLREDARKYIEQDTRNVYNKTIPVVYEAPSHKLGSSNHDYYTNDPDKKPILYRVGLNTNIPQDRMFKVYSTIFHEFGHDVYASDTPLGNLVRHQASKIAKNIDDYSIESAVKADPKFYYGYLNTPDEFRQRIMEGFKYGVENGLTSEEIYNSELFKATQLPQFFKKDFLIKALDTMLALTPFVIKRNDKSS